MYLDTSVVSHLFADDVPEKKNETNKMWETLLTREYEVLISPTTLLELDICPEPKKSMLMSKLNELDYILLEKSDEVNRLAEQYLNQGVLSPNSTNDCFHIAYAVVSRCDAIVSWNFKHLVNFKTINRVRIVNAMNKYPEMIIVSPLMVNEGENYGK